MSEEFDVICESSLNRVIAWINEYDIATITAFRHGLVNVTDNTYIGGKEIGSEYTLKENRIRNRQMKAKLLSFGYGVTNIHGSWIEGISGENSVEVGEESFFVVNINNDAGFYDNLFKLSEYFNQDSFLYKAKDSEIAYLVGTNMAEFPGYENKVETGTLTTLPSKFMSRIKNAAFAFVDKNNWIIKGKKDELTNDEMEDYANSYSWRIDDKPTFQNRKDKRTQAIKDKQKDKRTSDNSITNETLSEAEDYMIMQKNKGIILETMDRFDAKAKLVIGIIARNVMI